MTRRDRLDCILSAASAVKRVAESFILLTSSLVESKFALDCGVDDFVIRLRRAGVVPRSKQWSYLGRSCRLCRCEVRAKASQRVQFAAISSILRVEMFIPSKLRPSQVLLGLLNDLGRFQFGDATTMPPVRFLGQLGLQNLVGRTEWLTSLGCLRLLASLGVPPRRDRCCPCILQWQHFEYYLLVAFLPVMCRLCLYLELLS